jgi:hypothetical protein
MRRLPEAAEERTEAVHHWRGQDLSSDEAPARAPEEDEQ